MKQSKGKKQPVVKPLTGRRVWEIGAALLLLAVLEKRGNLKVSQCDAYLNIIGGLTLEEPAADLSAVVAIASIKKKINPI